MKRLLMRCCYVLFTLMLLLYFVPKSQLYYLLESQMLKKELVFTNEKIEESFLGLKLSNFDIYYKKQYVMQVKELDASYELLTPLELHINAQGRFGKLYANIDVINRKIVVALKASSILKRDHNNILSSMTLTKGVYTYEFEY